MIMMAKIKLAAVGLAIAKMVFVIAVTATGAVLWGGDLTIEQQVGRASLIVRARLAGWDNGIERYDVVRVIYGNLGDGPLVLDRSDEVEVLRRSLRPRLAKEFGREPTSSELDSRLRKEYGMEEGKEVILMLAPRATKRRQPPTYEAVGSFYRDTEDTIIRVIAKGDYLSPSFPQPSDVLEEHIRSTDLIVRAQLEQITATDSRWTVESSVTGNAEKKTLVVPHDLFRLRAEAIIRYELGTTRAATQADDQLRIAAEMQRMIQAELVPGRKAILFLSETRVDGEVIHARLRQRIFEDGSGKRLDKAEEAIHKAERHELPTLLHRWDGDEGGRIREGGVWANR